MHDYHDCVYDNDICDGTQLEGTEFIGGFSQSRIFLPSVTCYYWIWGLSLFMYFPVLAGNSMVEGVI